MCEVLWVKNLRTPGPVPKSSSVHAEKNRLTCEGLGLLPRERGAHFDLVSVVQDQRGPQSW